MHLFVCTIDVCAVHGVNHCVVCYEVLHCFVACFSTCSIGRLSAVKGVVIVEPAAVFDIDNNVIPRVTTCLKTCKCQGF